MIMSRKEQLEECVRVLKAWSGSSHDPGNSFMLENVLNELRRLEQVEPPQKNNKNL